MKNYKKASELGLEVVELEDQVLLVKNIEQFCDPWILQDNKQYPDEIIRTSHERDFGSRDKNIIASTKQLEGVTLLVIEDEVEKLAEEAELEYVKDCDPFTEYYVGDDFNDGFQSGYNKAKETYKFTEEDLRNGLDIITQGSIVEDEYFPLFTKDEIIKSLSKKELYIEVELHQIKASDKTGYTKESIISKIKANQIKAVWL